MSVSKNPTSLPYPGVIFKPRSFSVWNDLFCGCYQSLLRFCILYIPERAAAVLNTRSALQQFWKAATPLSCPEAIPLPHFPYLTLYSFMHSSKKAAKWCFSSVTYHHQPQSGFSQWQKINISGGDKICPPCCRGYCCRHTAELTFERIRLPHRTHSFSSPHSYLCWGKWEKGIKDEEGREQDYID